MSVGGGAAGVRSSLCRENKVESACVVDKATEGMSRLNKDEPDIKTTLSKQA